MSAALETQTSSYELARSYRDRGWRPFPIEPLSKVAYHWGVKTASEPTDKMLQLWFPDERGCNVGIGAKYSDLVILDEDTYGDLERLAADLGEVLPLTYVVHTAKGRHFYFSDDSQTIGCGRDLGGYDIDVKASGADYGGYVVAAGSHTRNEDTGAITEYIAVDSAAEVAPLPGWLRRWLLKVMKPAAVDAGSRLPASARPLEDRSPFTRKHAEAFISAPIRRFQASSKGTQNNDLNDAAMALGHFVTTAERPGHWSYAEADRWLREASEENGYATRDPQGMQGTIKSGLDAGIREPFPCQLDGPDEKSAASRPLNFPDEFWQKRETLKHIRSAARSWRRSPDALLILLMARCGAFAHPRDAVDLLGGQPSPLTIFGIPYGSPGTGKTSVAELAEELLPVPEYAEQAGFMAVVPSSGEGMLDAYYGLVQRTDDDGKPKGPPVREVVRDRVLFMHDEGEMFLQQAGRSGHTGAQTLRSMWSGAHIGTQNADPAKPAEPPAAQLLTRARPRIPAGHDRPALRPEASRRRHPPPIPVRIGERPLAPR
jgi:hypothetical protein